MSDDNSADAPGGRSPWARRILIAVAILFVGVIVYRLVSVRHGGHRHQPPQSVGVAAVTIGEMPETIRSLGTVTAIATVTVVPQLSGFLTEVGFTEGQDVAKGQFLAQIDSRPYQVQLRQYRAALDKDQAALDQAKSDLARYRRLARQTSIAEQQVTDQAFLVKQDEAAVEGDQANIATAKLDLGYCHITAPIAGRVGLRLIDPGNYVTASSSTGIVVIASMKPISVIFTVPQNQLADVLEHFHGGAKLPVTAFSSDNTSKIATGTLTAVSNQVSTTTGTVELRAVFPNEDERLFPNEFVNVSLLVTTLTNARLVPTPAVQTGVPGTYVYVVKPNHTVSLRKVRVGPGNGTQTVIESGLSAGETVVVDGVDRLSDGAKVVVPGKGGAAPKGREPRKHHPRTGRETY